MKVLTLTQPWASLVVIGAKKIETRSWKTGYRGALAIHAAKGYPKWAQDFVREEMPLKELSAFYACPEQTLPTGVIVGTCFLYDCREMVDADNNSLLDHEGYLNIGDNPALSIMEREFGDYSEGRFAFMLRNIQMLKKPIPAKGALGLWDFPVEVPAQCG